VLASELSESVKVMNSELERLQDERNDLQNVNGNKRRMDQTERIYQVLDQHCLRNRGDLEQLNGLDPLSA
jgi:hypothetical protein